MGEVAGLQAGRGEQLADQGALPGVFEFEGALGELRAVTVGVLRRGGGGPALFGAPGVVPSEPRWSSEGTRWSTASGSGVARASAPAAPASAGTAASSMEAEGLVAVVGHQVDASAGVLVHEEVASPAHVAVAVHKEVIDGYEPEGAVDVEHLAEDLLYPVGGSLLEKLAQLEDLVPGGFGRLGGLQVDVGLVVIEVLSEIAQARRTLGIGRDLPADAALGVVPVRQEVLIVLLDIEVDSPAHPVDDQLDVIGLRGRQVPARDMVKEHVAQEGRIGM